MLLDALLKTLHWKILSGKHCFNFQLNAIAVILPWCFTFLLSEISMFSSLITICEPREGLHFGMMEPGCVCSTAMLNA